MKPIKTQIEELEREIEKCKKGCGIKIGVPLLVKFRPCGETYKNKHYFCEECENNLRFLNHYLSIWKVADEQCQKMFDDYNKKLKEVREEMWKDWKANKLTWNEMELEWRNKIDKLSKEVMGE